MSTIQAPSGQNIDIDIQHSPSGHQPYQFVEDQGKLPRQDSQASTKVKKKFLYTWIASGILFINIIVLYILHFTHEHEIETASNSFNSFNTPKDGALGVGKVASLDENGNFISGAGQSFYLSKPNFDAQDLKHMYFPGTKDQKLVSYTKNQSVFLTTFDINEKKEILINNPSDKGTIDDDGFNILDAIVMSETHAVVVVRNKSFAIHVMSASINDKEIVLLKDKMKFIEFSPTSYLDKLSDTQFVINYFEKYSKDKPQSLLSRIGSLDSNGEITMHEVSSFGIENIKTNGEYIIDFGEPLGLSKEYAMIPYYVTPKNDSIKAYPGLCVDILKNTENKLTSLYQNCFEMFQPKYFIHAATISDDLIVVAFYDELSRYALTVATLEFRNEKLQLNRKYQVHTASGDFYLGSGKHLFPKPSLEVLSPTKIALGFLDPSNDGMPSVTIIGLNNQRQLYSMSSVIPLSIEKFTIRSEETQLTAVTIDIHKISESEFLLNYAGIVEGKQYHGFCVGELRPNPVGMVISTNGNEINIASTGLYKAPFVLEKGKEYYATTTGDIYPSKKALGSNMIMLENNIIVHKSSKIGQAVSSDTLLLRNF